MGLINGLVDAWLLKPDARVDHMNTRCSEMLAQSAFSMENIWLGS